jgi:hypothetical protein
VRYVSVDIAEARACLTQSLDAGWDAARALLRSGRLDRIARASVGLPEDQPTPPLLDQTGHFFSGIVTGDFVGDALGHIDAAHLDIVIEDLLAEPDDPFVAVSGIDRVVVAGHVYWITAANNAIGAFRLGSSGYTMNAFLVPRGTVSATSTPQNLATETQFVVALVWDGESLLFADLRA